MRAMLWATGMLMVSSSMVWAQARGSGGGGSPIGGGGASVGGSAIGGSSSLGSSRTGSGFNNSTFGSSLTINTPSAGNGSNPFQQALVDPTAQGRAGANNQNGQQSVNQQGANRGGQQQNGQNRGQQGGQNGQNGQQNNRSQRNGGNRNGQQGGTVPSGLSGGAQSLFPTKPVITVAFEMPPMEAGKMQTNLKEAITSQKVYKLNGVQVSLSSSGEAKLEGKVANEHQRNVAAALAAMEPGVRSVNTEQLVVAP